tara:strand:- start:55707 stop:55943 length:237 start_codon:yes stop_codon:yes gene_type:complete
MNITEDKQNKPSVMLEDITDGQCFIYHERASDSTQAAVRVSILDRRVTCIRLENGDFMTLDRANHVTPITITELRYKL